MLLQAAPSSWISNPGEIKIVTTSGVRCGRSVFSTRSDFENDRGHERPAKIIKRSARDVGLCDEAGRRD